jgi:6-phosphofructokinase 2
VIVARGSDGSVLAEANQRLFVKAAKVEVKSKVGAGDSFVAGFVLGLARGHSSAEALALGSAAASAAVMTDATQLCRAADAMRLLPQCLVSDV